MKYGTHKYMQNQFYSVRVCLYLLIVYYAVYQACFLTDQLLQ